MAKIATRERENWFRGAVRPWVTGTQLVPESALRKTPSSVATLIRDVPSDPVTAATAWIAPPSEKGPTFHQRFTP